MADKRGNRKGRTTPPKASTSRRSTVKKRSPSTRKKKKGRKIPIWLVVLLCMGAVLGITLYYLHLRPPPTPFPQRVRVVDQVLLAQFYQLEIPRNDIHKWGEARRREGKAWTLSYWEVILPQGAGPEKFTSQLVQKIKEVCPEVTLTRARAPDGAWGIELRTDGLLTHHLILRPPKLKPPKPIPLRHRIVIVVDDLGLDKKAAEEFLRLDVPLTFSILPLRSFSRRIAQRAHAQGREVILHLPMEPRGYPLKDPGEGALFVSMGEKELLRQLREDLEAIPYIRGVDNHMGSRFMEHGEKVRLVLQELKKRDLFFLDSLTTSKSKGYRIAQEMALKVGKRDLFLDNEANVKDIEAQLKRLIRIAQTHGKAIGICHPHPATITALKEVIPKLQAEGVEIVPLSQILD
ncbi:MAG: divergent polysaccharide deacetylase family protein [Deltaproteobacteria bacterium]|nr:divergent polysaccharide deacetylase family protein [Deltaproteobacteria bacterium]